VGGGGVGSGGCCDCGAGDCKKCVIEHDLVIDEIVIPSGVSDPVGMREGAVRKGKIVRRMVCDDGDEVSKDYRVEI